MNGAVPAAVKILILGGLANIVLSYALGWVLSKHRLRGPMQPHHWLLVAHTVSLQEGLLLLGVAFAMLFAKISDGLAVTGAVLLVAASLFQDFSGIVNWLRGTGDQFAEKSTGWVLASINAVLNTAGLAIATWGVANGLL
ncbi:MAG: hypothetical protein KF773_13660 [Deltaproteobacteria bacterium]|nr:hypothetical protein [Deltaproteobacteria bacterium]MCW5808712.1 hypothetical protein [Deltaproteobacteria bacterium]